MKLTRVWYLVLILSFVLAACGADTGDDQSTGTGAYPYPGALTTESPTGFETETGALATSTVSGMATQPSGTATVDGSLSTPETGATSAATSDATQPAGAQATQTPLAQSTAPAVGGAAAPTQGSQDIPSTGGFPPQSQRAEVRGDRAQLTVLSNLIGYQVVDQNGTVLGTVQDYVINTCETFIVYMVIQPASGTGSPGQGAGQGQGQGQGGNTNSAGNMNTNTQTETQSGAQAGGNVIVIPFEAVTINSGSLDAGSRTIMINATAGQFGQAPVFALPLVVTDTEWEGQVHGYWSKSFRISNLNTQCATESGRVRKVILASQLMGVQLRDGNDQPLGIVREAILEPESGSIDFLVVELPNGSMVMVPLGAVNIPEEALSGQGQTVWLVLLTDTQLLMSAPTVLNIEEASNAETQQAVRTYWNVPSVPAPQFEPGGTSQPGGTGQPGGTSEPVATDEPQATESVATPAP